MVFKSQGAKNRESSTPTPDGIFRGQRIIAHLQSLSLTEWARLEGGKKPCLLNGWTWSFFLGMEIPAKYEQP